MWMYEMNWNRSKTRPAAPGDVLARATAQCDAYYTVTLAAPRPHNKTGTDSADEPSVILRLYVPTCDPTSPEHHEVRFDLRDETRPVLSERLDAYWGRFDETSPGWRRKDAAFSAATIAAAVAEAVAAGDAALADVQAIADKHAASVRAYDERIAAYCAAYPIAIAE
jgi:hypothetical protein